MAWYHDFFYGLPQDAWRAAQTDEQTQLDLELLVETLNFGPGDRLLDVFCGYGRHALPLARMGARLTGVDIAPDYVAELRVAAGTLPVEVIEGDFLTVPIADAATFDAGYCLGNSFSFFDRPDMLRFLTRIAELLKPGGRFLAHTGLIAESVLPDYQARNWQPVGDDLLFLAEHHYDALAGRIDAHLTYVRGGKTETRLARHYVFTLAELARLCADAGLTVLAAYGTPDRTLYQLGDESLWLLTEKS